VSLGIARGVCWCGRVDVVAIEASVNVRCASQPGSFRMDLLWTLGYSYWSRKQNY